MKQMENNKLYMSKCTAQIYIATPSCNKSHINLTEYKNKQPAGVDPMNTT